MKNLKLYLILIVLTITLSYTALGLVFAKYQSHNKIGNINLNVTPRPQYELGGSDHDIIIEKNTQSDITVSMVPGPGVMERIYIPLDTVDLGLYQLSFDIYMTSESTAPIMNNTLYKYGCTIGDNENLDLGDYYYLWKSITPLEQEHVDLAFWATEEDVANGYIKWVWNLGNIRDGARSTLHITNIDVKKIATPSNPYIDFPYTQFVYGQVLPNCEYGYNYADETIGMYRYHPAKGTYLRQATYNELTFSMECLGGQENINIPIKGLTIGKTYTLSFDYKWTSPSNYNDSGSGMACGVVENKFTPNESVRHTLQYSIYRYPSEVNDVHFDFIAKSETMYWFWQGGGIYDSEWFTMWVYNASVVEVA